MKLAWGAKVDKQFRQKVLDICKEFNWPDSHASWLMACMAFETGGTFDPAIKNAAGSGATGLIQFMPKTAIGLGTTTDQLAEMTQVQQLEYVKEYFKPYSKKIRTLSDMYMAILAPVAVGKSEDMVLYSSGAAYRLNAPLDINSDGKITKREAASYVYSRLEKGLGYGMWAEVDVDLIHPEAEEIINNIYAELEKLKGIIL